ncbi:MAG: sulfurtransferase [Ilumatobacter sp.]|nr:sulfurtransferase [Ilumatobacter sp.]
MNDFTNPDALVDTEWLASHLDDPAVAIVEVDEDTTAYTAGHIPGATSLDWTADLHATPRRDFVNGDELAALFEKRGIGDDRRIVFYGGNNNWFAAYAYWLCKHRGIDDVTLLDGGRIKWELEERPLTTEVTPTSHATMTLGVERPDIRAFRDEVVALAHGGVTTMIDVRSPAEFTGEVLAPPHLPKEQPYVPGHVPGARNIPWSQAANEDGTFRSAGELAELYGDAATGAVVAYCRIGERSSHTWFVLSELLGNTGAKNYDGSWTEYGSLVGVPVETGAGS